MLRIKGRDGNCIPASHSSFPLSFPPLLSSPVRSSTWSLAAGSRCEVSHMGLAGRTDRLTCCPPRIRGDRRQRCSCACICAARSCTHSRHEHRTLHSQRTAALGPAVSKTCSRWLVYRTHLFRAQIPSSSLSAGAPPSAPMSSSVSLVRAGSVPEHQPSQHTQRADLHPR